MGKTFMKCLLRDKSGRIQKVNIFLRKENNWKNFVSLEIALVDVLMW